MQTLLNCFKYYIAKVFMLLQFSILLHSKQAMSNSDCLQKVRIIVLLIPNENFTQDAIYCGSYFTVQLLYSRISWNRRSIKM